MDPWVDLISPVVGAALAVSTIFFPVFIVISETQWHQSTSATLYVEQ